jgi:hypothetical protein
MDNYTPISKDRSLVNSQINAFLYIRDAVTKGELDIIGCVDHDCCDSYGAVVRVRRDPDGKVLELTPLALIPRSPMWNELLTEPIPWSSPGSGRRYFIDQAYGVKTEDGEVYLCYGNNQQFHMPRRQWGHFLRNLSLGRSSFALYAYTFCTSNYGDVYIYADDPNEAMLCIPIDVVHDILGKIADAIQYDNGVTPFEYPFKKLE